MITEFRKLINLVESKMDLKKEIISTVNSIDDDDLLHNVLDTLKSGNIDKKIASVLAHNADTKQFAKQIAQTIINVEAPIEVKETFLAKYPSGIIDPQMLLDGKTHTFLELCGGDYFAAEVFSILCTQLTAQGVGPGEVALAAFSPDISWSGRAIGGGDIQVGNKAIEVKTSVTSGGRWINARKAKIDMAGVALAIQKGETEVQEKHFDVKEPKASPLPDRLTPEAWCKDVRPKLEPMPAVLNRVAKKIADAVFKSTNNHEYSQALINGDADAIKKALLRVGYENYKSYSKFDGILMMDVSSETSQYFDDFDSMEGRIKSSMPYVYGPESEAMPKVELIRPAKTAAATSASPDDVTDKKKSATVSKDARVSKEPEPATPEPKPIVSEPRKKR